MSAGRVGRPAERRQASPVPWGLRGWGRSLGIKCSEKSAEVFEQRSEINGVMSLKGHLGSCEESGWKIQEGIREATRGAIVMVQTGNGLGDSNRGAGKGDKE